MLLKPTVAFLIFVLIMGFLFPLKYKDKIGYGYVVIWQAFLIFVGYYAFTPFWPQDGLIKFPLTAGPHFIKTGAAQILLLLYLFPLLAIDMGRKFKSLIWIGICLFMVIDMTGLLFVKLTVDFPQYFSVKSAKFLMDATTFDATIGIIVAAFCIIKERTTWPTSPLLRATYVFLTPVCLYIGHKTTYFVAFSGLATWFIFYLPTLRQKFFATSGCVVLTLVLVIYNLDAWVYSDGRASIIEHHGAKMQYSHLLRGFGPGSFEWNGLASPLQVVRQKLNGTRFVYAHNDYFQILYEYGLPMFLVFLSFLSFTFYRVRKSVVYVTMLVMLSVCMLTYFPVHFMPPLLMGVMILNKAIAKD